ncbi:pre-mRNA-processing protein 40A-like isoform X1 [Amaranthus tricolor]|uniref:pre-mRNA-processing protein 40A-like isoform X1 n=1 Tax=Amaranthus tricolor TaxID=29722 RepID=UPI00258AF653|nr:pre-mRNA-processing protein 40A-like isoform X1 [Amaranthus tricolor]XP_057527373.1 pre-mRNA-processing protein 40A-like isoform X1 [Amaranthus tricolor]XP_057527374.1 pre-mRNA-processing protein 40A-like isoform X1 [Amaranthus tricolor]XP_057527375.1 pre-mRNA-processing protein 40A-like isoform X1 [Amaranthus tricolor]
MANNSQYNGGPGPPHHPPMVGSIAPLQNIPPQMPAQFRTVAPMHASQQFAPSASQQYQPIVPTIPTINVGMPPTQNQQIHFAQHLQQMPSAGHVPPTSQSVPLSNVQLNRPMSTGLLQPMQNLQAPSSFTPATGSPGMPPVSAYAQNTYPTSHYQPVTHANLQSNAVSGQPLPASGNQDASFASMQQSGQPPTSISTALPVEPKPVEKSSSDWIEHTKNGRRFYYNKKTKRSTWEKPFELMTPIERADATTDWKEFSGPDGRKYFYNKVTKQSKWLIPEELKLAREHAEKTSIMLDVAPVSASQSHFTTPSTAEIKSLTPVAHSSPAIVTPVAGVGSSLSVSSPGTDTGTGPSVAEPLAAVDAGSDNPGTAHGHAASADAAPLPINHNSADSTEEAVKSLQTVLGQEVELQEDDKSTGNAGKTNDTAPEEKAIEPEPPTYSSKQEAKDAFKALLDSVNVESDWTWEQAMRLIINDKRYAALRSLGERKQAFNEYLSQKKKQEAEERRAKNRKAREDFKKMLEESSELTSSTRWGKVVNMFGNDERFEAIERVRDREDIYEEFVADLEKKERAKAEEERQHNMFEYRKFLESCDFIKATSQWRRVKDRLEGDQRCSRLDKMDQLKIFQEYVCDLEKEEEEQHRIQKEETRKAERRNRDEFRKLMEGHVSDGILTAKTLWREYHAKIKDIPAYVAVSSNSSGSTPKELFEDVAEELKKQYEEDRTRIKDAVKSEKVILSSTWTLEEFKAAIANELSSPEVSENNLKQVFEELLERVREKEEKEAKKQKRLGDEFFNILCSLKDITVDSKWEDCLPLFEDKEEFRAIGDEAFAWKIFEEYLDQLKEKEDREQKRKDEKAKREKERERDKRSRDKREKDKRRDRDRGKDRTARDDGDVEPDLDKTSGSIQGRRSGKDKDKKHRKRHHDDENDSSLERNGKDHSRSSHRHSSEHKRSRQTEEQFTDVPGFDNESKHKRHKREHRNGSRRKPDNEDLEDGELAGDL